MSKEIVTTPSGQSFSIDLSQAPYTAPCPVCRAFALAPCRTERRPIRTNLLGIIEPRQKGEKLPGRIMPDPHAERWEHWRNNPGLRVTPK